MALQEHKKRLFGRSAYLPHIGQTENNFDSSVFMDKHTSMLTNARVWNAPAGRVQGGRSHSATRSLHWDRQTHLERGRMGRATVTTEVGPASAPSRQQEICAASHNFRSHGNPFSVGCVLNTNCSSLPLHLYIFNKWLDLCAAAPVLCGCAVTCHSRSLLVFRIITLMLHIAFTWQEDSLSKLVWLFLTMSLFFLNY